MKNNYLQRIKAILVLLVLLFATVVSTKANPVDIGRARQMAANFLNINRSEELVDVSAQAGFTNIYVFTTESSFVLMAADDRVQPILGYSLNGRFDYENMPDNKRAWIQSYSDNIQYAVEQGLSASSEVAQQWRDLSEGHLSRSSRSVVVGPLVQTQWDQGTPFNALCPSGTVTGCVATAMAQVMKYWNHPAQGIGSHTYTHPTYGVQTADFRSTTYDWSNMLNSYSGSYNSTQQSAVATLMYHCGVSVEMNYGPASTGGSGASTADVVYALKNYFNYSQDVVHYDRSDFTTGEWIALLKNDLDQSRPIQYHGSSTGGGHSFVCDGYDSRDYFHFNWGWGGYCDEYYSVDNLEPGTGGIGAGTGIFNQNQGVVMRIHPSTCTVSAPTNLNYTLSGRTATLTWTAATGAASYNVYCNSELVGYASSNTFEHMTPYGGAVYYVRSVDSNGELSMPSNTVSITLDYPTPVVDDLAATVYSGTDVTLTWTDPDWCYPSEPTDFMTYGDGSMIGGVGITGFNLYWGHCYPASTLGVYNGMQIYKVSFYVREIGNYEVHLYKGSTSGTYGENIPATHLTSQAYFAGATGWHDVDLSEIIQVDDSEDLWVFIYDPEGKEFPIAYGPSTEEGGSYYTTNPNSWLNTHGDYSHTYAFLIRTFVTDNNYSYDVYRNGTCINSNSTYTNWQDNFLAPGTYSYYVKTHYYAGVSEPSNTVTVTIGSGSYEITATANPTAGGTVSGGGTYDSGATCTLTATENEGYTFINWTKNGTEVSTDLTYSFTVTESAAYVANFGLNGYQINASANPADGGTVSGAGVYDYGTSCTLTATPATGYTFVNWTKNGTQVSTSPNYSFTVTEDATFVANFQANGYTITATANPTAGGTVSGGGSYNYGATCTLTATESEGYTFINWTKNGTEVSTDLTYSFTVTESATYVANFGLNGYQITASANPADGGTVSGEGVYDYGTSCTLTATPATGYAFVNWTKNGTEVSTSPNYSFTVTEDAAFVANFQVNSYTITATANPTAGGTVSGGGSFNYGATCTLTATESEGYTFVNWTKNGTEVSTDLTYSFTVTETAAYVANFELDTYEITANANPADGGTVSGAGTYEYGDNCTLTATESEGYTFVNWTKNGTQVSTSPNYSFTVTETAAYVANFELNSYDITVTANPTAGGTVTGAGTYNHFETCTLTATENEGYTFVNWTKDGTVVSTSLNYSFTVTEAAAYVANFELNSYEITSTANPSSGGTITGAGTYYHFETCTLTATPRTGYIFLNWTKDGTVVTTSTTYSFEVTEEAAYVANFQIITYDITATADPVEGGTITGAGTYDHGTTCTLTATANEGYTFTKWTKNGTVVTTNPSFSFTALADADYVAHFTLNMYLITVAADPTIGGTVDGGGAYLYGENCTVIAVSNNGYTFTNWTKNGTVVSTNSDYTFTVTDDADLVAHFGQDHYTISVSADPEEGGTASGGGSFTYGQTCTLTATPETGYSFVNWTKDGNEVSSNASYSFTVTGSADYVAHFAVARYTITVVAEPAEGGIVHGGGTHDYGSIVTLRAIANDNYVFENWTKDGNVISTNAIHAVRVTEDAEYVANFSLNVFEIDAKTDPDNTGDIEGIGFYEYGETCTLTVTPHDEYEFVNWTLDGVVVSEEETFSFVVTEERDYVAHLQHLDGVGEQNGITVTMFPNPAKSKLTIETSEPVNELEIYNINGALISRQTNCTDKMEINVSDYAIGTYMIRLTTESTVEIRRFVKE